MFGSLDISTSGLVAQRVRMDTISANIANMYNTGDASGAPNPYQRKFPVFVSNGGQGVRVASVEADTAPGRLVEGPAGHPHLIRTGPNAGKLQMPNVDINCEMVNAIEAARSYEANITALQVSKQMIASDLRILA